MNILLVHGLGRTPVSMFGLASALRRAGHMPRFFGYSPTLESLPRIVRRLSAHLETMTMTGHPVGLVGHSLGGLLLRMALAEVPQLRVSASRCSARRTARRGWRLGRGDGFRSDGSPAIAVLSWPIRMRSPRSHARPFPTH